MEKSKSFKLKKKKSIQSQVILATFQVTELCRSEKVGNFSVLDMCGNFKNMYLCNNYLESKCYLYG